MSNISIGVLTISDRCFRNDAIDESGQNLVKMINDGIVRNGEIVKFSLVPDCKEEIQKVLSDWCDEKIDLILTTGGTGLSKRDVTPEATTEVVEKTVQGIQALIFKRSSEITNLACLSRGVAGVKGKSLIINFPGSKKASKECLEAVADVIPHAIDLLNDREINIERLHTSLSAKKSSVVVNPSLRKRESLYPCLSVDEAQQIIMCKALLLRKDTFINCEQASNYVLAEDFVAMKDIPPFDASLKDGYAIKSEECNELLEVTGVSHPGHLPSENSVTNCCCCRIATGAAIPSGADAVIPVEQTVLVESTEDGVEERKIRLRNFPRMGDNIRPKGSDIYKGQLLFPFKTFLDESAVAVLLSVEATSVRVFGKPVVAVISSGDELVDVGDKIEPGKVRDINRTTLLGLLKKEYFQCIDLGICPDHPDALRDWLERGFRAADVVVTTGNLSMGDKDFIKDILVADFNAEIFFGRVFMKPGMPTSFALVTFEGKLKLWFGLPGNPASAFVTSHLFLLPALRLASGQQDTHLNKITARLEEDFELFADRPNYIRGILKFSNEKWWASVNGNQQSSCIRSCANANCLLLFPVEAYSSQKILFKRNSIVSALVIGKIYFKP